MMAPKKQQVTTPFMGAVVSRWFRICGMDNLVPDSASMANSWDL
jgi:hypothetical protein